MIGINVDNLETLIKKNNLYLNSYSNNSKRLVSAISELNDCYGGSSLEYLFIAQLKQINNIKIISSIIESYSNVLSNVKISYQKQDQNTKIQINRINSNLK